MPTRHLTLSEFSREVGAHPNTVRKLLREGAIPYLVVDLSTGAEVPADAARPKRFRYMLDADAVQHVVALLHDPVRSPSQPSESPHPDTPQLTAELRERVRSLESEVAWLRQRVETADAERAELIARVPLALPPAPERRPWWRRWFR